MSFVFDNKSAPQKIDTISKTIVSAMIYFNDCNAFPYFVENINKQPITIIKTIDDGITSHKPNGYILLFSSSILFELSVTIFIIL